jgi:hypothetical protein
MKTLDEMIKAGYTQSQIDAARKADTQEKVTTGALIGSGAIIGAYAGGPLGALIGAGVGGLLNWGRSKLY